MGIKTFLSIVQRNLMIWILLPGVAFILLIAGWNVWSKVHDFMENSGVLVNATSRYVSNYVNDAQTTLKSFSNKIIKSETKTDLKQKLASLSGLYPHFKRLVWLSNDKLVLAAYPTGIEGTDFPLIMREVGANELLISRPMPSIETGEIVIYLGYVTSTGNSIVAELDLESLKEHIDGLLLEDFTVIVTDQHGNVVLHPEKDLVRQQANLSDLKILNKSRSGLLQSFYEDKEEYFIGSVASLPGTKWLMIVSQPARLLLMPVIQTSAILLFLLFLFSIFFVVRLRRSLGKLLITPLNQFIDQIQITAKGEYNVSSMQNASFHELGVMQKEFQAMARRLLSREEELKQYGEELEEMVQERTEKLTTTVSELEKLNEESTLMTRFGDLLQACESGQESYSILTSICERFYRDSSGYFAITDDDDQSLIAVSGFGDHEKSKLEFESYECWALRQGRPHIVSRNAPEPPCSHTRKPFPEVSMCVPVIARGKSLGVLHIERGTSHDSDLSYERNIEDDIVLAKRIVELYALSLSNIRLREELRIQSIRDTLTGLYNRRHMEDSLKRELKRAQRKNTQFGVILIDVDHFKQFNDTYGHETGDLVLQKLGVFLNSHTRGEDIACRYGGEELLIILPDCSQEDCLSRAKQIRLGVERMILLHNGSKLQITISLGVATYPHHGDTTDIVLSAADKALYLAKEQGRNRAILAG